MSSFYLNPPYAPESNPPVRAEYYSPGRFVISSISLGQNTIITTVENHNYVVGQIVRLDLTQGNKCTGINGSTSYVVSIPSSTQVVLNLYSANQTPFVANPSNTNSSPQIVAIGDINSGQQNTGRTGNATYIPGSFIDIS